jgi:hypothetical protein
MWCVFKLTFLLGVGLATLPARAQMEAPTLAPSKAVECLTPPMESRGKPEYPEELLSRKQGGRVRVQLVFNSPEEEPIVGVLDDSGFGVLLSAVRKHVREFRVPCMQRGDEPVRVVQEYLFTPNDGRKVMASAPKDGADVERRARLGCMTRIAPGLRPSYTQDAFREGEKGKVFARLRFTSATEPPEVKFLAAERNTRYMRLSVEKFVAGYRLPCLTESAIELTQLFHFDDGSARNSLKDLSLPELVRAAKEVPVPAFFDTVTMGCPFDVRLTYYRPHALNQIRELESSDPARQPLIDWLGAITLNFDHPTNTNVLGESMTVSVPCLKIDL